MSGTAGDFVADFALTSLGSLEGLDNYAALLRKALTAESTPYGEAAFGVQYRWLARRPSFFASLLVSDAHLEGYSAGQLWGYADQLEDAGFAAGMRGHARDEARHSRMFANLLFSVFPGLRDQQGLELKLAAMAPRLAPTAPGLASVRTAPADEVLNTAILINLHEVKALVLEALLRPLAAAYSEAPAAPRAVALVDRLIDDEVRHIRYTAEFIERAVAAGRRGHVEDAIVGFQSLLNASTREELEQTDAAASALEHLDESRAAPCIS